MEANRRENDVTVVRPPARLDAGAAPAFKAFAEPLVGEGESSVVVDFSGVDFVDSGGLGCLIGLVRKARAGGGDMIMAAPSERVRSIFRLTRFHRVVEIFDDVNAAAEALGREASGGVAL